MPTSSREDFVNGLLTVHLAFWGLCATTPEP